MEFKKQFKPQGDSIITLIFGVLAAVSIFCSFIIPSFDMNVFDHDAVAKRLLLSGISTLLIGVFSFIAGLFYNPKNRSVPALIAKSLLFSLLIEAFFFFAHSSVLPQLHWKEPVTPIEDIKTAMEILNDDSEPLVETGVFRRKTYTVIVKARPSSSSYKMNRFTLESEKGTEIISNWEENGFYTITYSGKTMLPYSIEPYDFNCGENVVEWCFNSTELEDWDSRMPPLQIAECTKTERTFPKMKMRITHNGEVIAEKYFSDQDENIAITQNETGKGLYEAQLFGVIEDLYYTNEILVPISNAAPLTLE